MSSEKLLFTFLLSSVIGFSLIGFAPLTIPATGLPDAPPEMRHAPDGKAGDPDAKNTVDVKFMVRGYCNAGTRIKDRKAFGGFATSDNLPKRIKSKAAKSTGECYLLAQPTIAPRFGDVQGMRLTLVNATDDAIAFEASDSRLSIVQEARDKSGLRLTRSTAVVQLS